MKIVIIGAGVAGLSIGWRLAQAGKQVTILERAQPGAGATWASAGMLAVTAELLDASAAEIEFARYSNTLWPDFAAELEAESGRKIGFRRPGALILAEDAVGLPRLERQAAGVLLNAAQVREMVPALTGEIAGALWAEQEALVDNRALAQALTLAFRKAGGKLLANEAVVRIEQREGGAIAALTPFGLYHGDAIVLAAGAWTGGLESAAAIVPVKGQMIALAPPGVLSGAPPPGTSLPDGPVIWGNGIYAVPRGDMLLIGATVERVGFDTSLTTQARDDLRARAEKLMPVLRGWRLADHWAGLRPRAPDGLPLLGPAATPGLYLACGQYRNGILFAPAMARNMTDQLLGKKDAAIPAFDPGRL